MADSLWNYLNSNQFQSIYDCFGVFKSDCNNPFYHITDLCNRGGCILSGIFSVGEVKSLATLSEKIHGYGSVIGFMCLTFAPLFVGIYSYKINNIKFFYFSIGCFILAILCFSCFVMGDKPNAKNTFLAFEGLWQRLSLLFMYLPLGCLILLKKINC
ncbi:DUF998 domain-containing protein [Anaerostipes sp. PC18]|uniref:DUF998 domain-containing protein n=1 Tax=Anaerostipes sp. PC18 TaxID=3036926 RepID=UPI00322039DA